MNKQRLAILITAALGMLATFLPWVKVPIVGTINGTQGDGWITFALYLIPLIIALTGDKTKSIEIKSTKFYLSIVPAILAAILGIYKIIDLQSAMGGADENNPFAKALASSFSIEFGLYLVVLAGITLVISTFVIKDTAPRQFV